MSQLVAAVAKGRVFASKWGTGLSLSAALALAGLVLFLTYPVAA